MRQTLCFLTNTQGNNILMRLLIANFLEAKDPHEMSIGAVDFQSLAISGTMEPRAHFKNTKALKYGPHFVIPLPIIVLLDFRFVLHLNLSCVR